MKNIPLDILEIKKMASGGNYLLLSENPNWEDFPEYCELLGNILNIKFFNEVETVSIRMKEFIYQNEKFNFVFDDYPLTLSIEPINYSGSRKIPNIKKRLLTSI